MTEASLTETAGLLLIAGAAIFWSIILASISVILRTGPLTLGEGTQLGPNAAPRAMDDLGAFCALASVTTWSPDRDGRLALGGPEQLTFEPG